MDKKDLDLEVEGTDIGYAVEVPTADHRVPLSRHLANPLHDIPRDQLVKDVELFAQAKGLTEHLPDLQKGALLAQNPGGFEGLDVLDEEDRKVIRHERAHKWSHPRTLYATVFLCSLGAATQGWDQTGSNGANLSFPVEFGIHSAKGDPNYERDGWIVGLVNAAPYIGSALLGCWLSDPLNNLFGRRGTIFITALILIATPIASGFTHSWHTLLICRLILGVGMGAKGATVPIFAAENSPHQIRGALVMGWQMWTAFGIFLGFAANAAVAHTGSIAWRLQLGSAFIPAFPLAIFIYFCPESPRWLMKKDRYQQAYKSLLRLRFTPLQAARDLYYIHVQLQEEKKILGGANYISRFMELFTIPRVRRATLASWTVMIAQQMCGINIIAFYSSTVFVQTGYTPLQALYVSLGFGAVNFLFAIPALFTIDTYGRRALLLFTFPQMTWSLLAAGLCYMIEDSKTRLSLVALFIFIFAAWYSPGEGPVPWTYSAEVFPLAHREQGMAFAVATCLFWSAVLSLSYPSLEQAVGVTGAFGFYAGLNVAAFVMILLFVPETKGLTLEELDAVFSVPTATFINHTFTQAIPYWIKRWLFWRRDITLAPLIENENDQDPAVYLPQQKPKTEASHHE
jgi:sugar porter (SP) family MFS transporter